MPAAGPAHVPALGPGPGHSGAVGPLPPAVWLPIVPAACQTWSLLPAGARRSLLLAAGWGTAAHTWPELQGRGAGSENLLHV